MSSDSQHREVIDPCPHNGRSHLDAEPVDRISHLSLDDDLTTADVVTAICPDCGDVLIDLELESYRTTGVERESAGWTSLTGIKNQTHDGLSQRECSEVQPS